MRSEYFSIDFCFLRQQDPKRCDRIAPFDVSLMVLLVMCLFIFQTWPEKNGGVKAPIRETFTVTIEIIKTGTALLSRREKALRSSSDYKKLDSCVAGLAAQYVDIKQRLGVTPEKLYACEDVVTHCEAVTKEGQCNGFVF
ncbi:hypothetical protein Q1695_006968 [Nippostrongylus brasiliensis]|nr:hypothetical protein Q1695_006968 [Nippostrongylus brasiliensis]